jgi:hypothetical protein
MTDEIRQADEQPAEFKRPQDAITDLEPAPTDAETVRGGSIAGEERREKKKKR